MIPEVGHFALVLALAATVLLLWPASAGARRGATA